MHFVKFDTVIAVSLECWSSQRLPMSVPY